MSVVQDQQGHYFDSVSSLLSELGTIGSCVHIKSSYCAQRCDKYPFYSRHLSSALDHRFPHEVRCRCHSDRAQGKISVFLPCRLSSLLGH